MPTALIINHELTSTRFEIIFEPHTFPEKKRMATYCFEKSPTEPGESVVSKPRV